MHVFVTGATGWIGSATVKELLATGHQVTGLARSDASAAKLDAWGAGVLRGDLGDLDVLRKGAEGAEAVIHLGFNHDFSDPAGAGRMDRAAVETIGDALVGTDRRFFVASGVAGMQRPVTEDQASPFVGPDAPRGGTEGLALDYACRDVRSAALRFAPTVHGTGDHGFIAHLAGIAREKGVAGYPGDGTNGWAAVHVTDAARMIRLALTGAPAGSRLHAIGETSVPTRQIAEAIGRAFDLPVSSIAPEQVSDHFGWIGQFFGTDMSATSVKTQELLGWTPVGPGLIKDIDSGAYAQDAVVS